MRSKVRFLLALGVAILLPALALAQGQGLVSCSGWASCNLCALSDLVQNIINFLVGISIPIAAVLFAWAGILYFTQATNPGNIDKARKIFSSVAIGFLIVIGGWLIVQTVLKTLVAPQYYQSWQNIKCISTIGKTAGTRLAGFSIGDLLKSLPGLNTGQYATQNWQNWEGGSNQYCDMGGCYPISGCPNGSSPTGSGGCEYCDEMGCYDVPSEPSQVGKGDCSPGAMSGTWGSSAAAFSCIAQAESSCNPGAVGDNGFSIGMYQINMSANNVICNGQTLPCPTAFSQSYTCRNGVCTNPQVINPTLAQQCKDTLKRLECNTQTAQAIYSRGGYRPWTTASKCGY